MRPHSCGMYIVLVGDLTCCVTTICVLVSTPPGYMREDEQGNGGMGWGSGDDTWQWRVCRGDRR